MTAEALAPGVNSLDPELRADLILAAMGGVPDTRDARHALTAVHPLVFALTYLSHHIKDDKGVITFADMHVDLCDMAAREWTVPNSIKGGREVVVAPRECGKSTWCYLILPMWAAAHGYTKFVAAFSDTASQATRHLTTFKRELDENDLLRLDYPGLTTAAKRPGGRNVSDAQGRYISQSGFAFSAMGIDGPAHGLKEGANRPDLIILDDISSGIGNVTLYEEEKRLETLRGSIFYLNLGARVLLAGTTTIAGGIMHQLVQQREEWIAAENLRIHYYPALYSDETGSKRSTWPLKWSVDWLEQERRVNRREFARNMMNLPVPINSEYWTDNDFHYGRLASPSRRIISIDPAVTTAKSSDETGIAVVSFSVAERKACVDEVLGVKVKGEPLRQRVLTLLAKYPDVSTVLFERNQGGDMMAESVLHDMPVRVQTVHATEKKELRAERLLNYYRRGVVLHAERNPDYEQQCMEFPRGLHDDLIDAVGQAVDYFAAPKPATKLRSAIR